MNKPQPFQGEDIVPLLLIMGLFIAGLIILPAAYLFDKYQHLKSTIGKHHV